MKNMAQISARYIGQSFEAYGCLEFVVAFLKDLGWRPPTEIDGWSLSNYRDLVEDDIKQAQDVMVQIFKGLGRPASIDYPESGSLLVVQQPSGVLFPAVCTGFGMALASFIRTGICMFELDKQNKPVVARRVL